MLISRLVDRVSRFANGLAILMLITMFLHIIIEIVLRNIFDTSTFVLDEFVGYFVSSLTFLALGQAFRKRSLIQVGIIKDRLPHNAAFLLDLIGRSAAAFVGTVLVVYLSRNVIRDFERGTVSSSIAEVPQYIPKSIVLFGAAVFLLCVVESIASMIRAHKSGESKTTFEGS